MQLELEMIQAQIQENPELLTQFVKGLAEKRSELVQSQIKIENFFKTLEELRKEFSPAKADSSVSVVVEPKAPAPQALEQTLGNIYFPLEGGEMYRFQLLTSDNPVLNGRIKGTPTNVWGQPIPATVQRYKVLEILGRRNNTHIAPTWVACDRLYEACAIIGNLRRDPRNKINLWVGEATVEDGKVFTYRRKKVNKIIKWSQKSGTREINNVIF